MLNSILTEPLLSCKRDALQTIISDGMRRQTLCDVISGRVRCLIEPICRPENGTARQERHELKTGDTIYFNSGQAHQMENVVANFAKVLCVAVPLAL